MTTHHQHYINGEFVADHNDKWIEVINPATEALLSRIPQGSDADAQRAILAAEAAQPQWEALPAVERGVWLHKIATAIRAREPQLTATIVAEGGKTQGLAQTEVLFTADYLDYMAEWARRYEGEIINSDRPNENIFLFKKAIGVTTGILPWNFPFFLIARKAAPALITGNTIVIKPSELTPNNAAIFADILHTLGLPAGVINFVYGYGPEVGQELAANPKVGLVSLTGSVGAGVATMQAAAKNVTKVSLELGGKAPAIVMDDADIDLAVRAIVSSRMINSGQVCNCAERVYVQDGIYDRFIAALTAAFRQVKLGDPAQHSDIDMGPLINAAALQRVEQKVANAVAAGATVVLGGKRVGDQGFFFEPTLITGVRQEMEIMQEEIFGPVLPVMRFKTLDEAIALANDCQYGLTSSLYTRDINTTMKALRQLKFGETYVNRENFEAMQGFHAGWRKSGVGGADGKHGLEEFLQTHVAYLQFS
ncbi:MULTISPECIES: aldehyde dehydrogenase [Pantoea]|jgi:lactaldehyde dehydrogenase/glycolaldehyde dehydrogenase|uniref:Aldehyde dehydrogenase n=1 Tax=Pantoea brenneri TaxID=472694 RepID=A0A7Y6NB92_9GAMM|nr:MULTISPECIES: aldehyde dehydrogenase [Pantoea]MBZ6393680.1 aldehyde dehydrogenase [Pantoea sp.]MBZ6437337.1 aldehyde dehydrogenase [Pantoea sp.]NUY40409.1 aldehyde dehydrogenase [Pantoea brenneri]NUY47507.1 aldehyde dehydrogenase [Pantoea brenneri]NUY57834.1 aldehyde dehydrogenase [Pantoea brenneri]